jgi:peptide/nickel transport system permease protein
MIKLIFKKLMAALAIIVGVHLVLFLALQSPAFGDPIARETNFSNDRVQLISAAQRLGYISSSNFDCWSFTISGSKEQNYKVSMQPNFELRDQSAVVFSVDAPTTLGELVAAINSNGSDLVKVSAKLVEDKYSSTPCSNIALAYLSNSVTVKDQEIYHAATVEPVSTSMRFANSFYDLLTFDFGDDHNSRPITNTLWQRGLRSLGIAAPSFFLIFIGAYLMAVFAHSSKRASRVLNLSAIAFMSLPALLYIFVLRQTFVINLEWAPLRPYSDPVIPLFILPILITVFIGIWPEYLLMRSFIDQRMRQQFMQSARAQGISQRRIWWRHLLPNLAGPLSQHVALNLPFLVLGSLLLETIFNIPGLGISIVDAIQNHDSNMLRAITFLIAIAFLTMQAVATMVARYFDPRQRSEGKL